MEPDLAEEASDVLERVLRDIEATAGVPIQAEVYWVTPQEGSRRAAEWDAWLRDARSNPRTKYVVVGDGAGTGDLAGIFATGGHWEVRVASGAGGGQTMVHDVFSIVDSIQEAVIEARWGTHVSAAWPECPEHRTHPLTPSRDLDRWVCPNGAVEIRIGELGAFEAG